VDLVERLPDLVAVVDDDRAGIARADALEQVELERLRLLAAVGGRSGPAGMRSCPPLSKDFDLVPILDRQ